MNTLNPNLTQSEIEIDRSKIYTSDKMEMIAATAQKPSLTKKVKIVRSKTYENECKLISMIKDEARQ
jgi:hypothetical protein